MSLPNLTAVFLLGYFGAARGNLKSVVPTRVFLLGWHVPVSDMDSSMKTAGHPAANADNRPYFGQLLTEALASYC